MGTLDKYKPAAPKSVLIFLAGFVWFCVGWMLLTRAAVWLAAVPGPRRYVLAMSGGMLGLLAHRYVFSRIADRNLARLMPLEGKRCLFSFIPWKSYIIITFMIVLGATLRHSAIPKPDLAIVYTAIGLALFLSGLSYGKAFLGQGGGLGGNNS